MHCTLYAYRDSRWDEYLESVVVEWMQFEGDSSY